MKSLFLVALISFTSTFLFGQLTRTGSFIANDPGVYPISGDASLTRMNGNLTINFASNFETVQGLVLEVFLTKTTNLDLGTDIKISTTPLGANVNSPGQPISGAYSFNVPAGVDLYEFNYIIVQCTSINELWGSVNLCDNPLTINQSPLDPEFYLAEKINSSSELSASSSYSFEARTSIDLNEGFQVPLSTQFSANTGPMYGCSGP